MSVRQRIFFPMIVTTLVVSVAILIASAVIYSNSTERGIEHELRNMMRVVHNEIDHLHNKSYFTAMTFAYNEKLLRALVSKDHEAIIQEAHSLFEESQAEIYAVIDPFGHVIARFYGDEDYDLSNLSGLQTALNGENYSAIVEGEGLPLAVISIKPVYDNHDRQIAAVITGFRIDTEAFVDTMHDITGLDFSVYRDVEKVVTTLLRSDGTRNEGTILPGNIYGVIRNNEEISGKEKILDDQMMTFYSPIISSNGQAVGIFLLSKSLTHSSVATTTFILTGAIITLIIIIISSFGIWKVAKIIAKPIDQSLDKILYDPLTGLHNRRYLNERLSSLIKSLSRSNSHLSVMMLDIDCFKPYNDTYGHAEGDNCLKTVADVLLKCIDRSDDFIVRYGGEEFTVVLPNTNEAGAKVIAKKILERIRARNILHEKSTVTNHVTLSIGAVAGKVLPSHDVDFYIKQADELLYLSKQNGRNRYTFKNF